MRLREKWHKLRLEQRPWGDASGPSTSLQTSAVHRYPKALAWPQATKKKKKTPPKPPETWQPRDPPIDTKTFSAKQIQLLFHFSWVNGLRLPPAACPPALSSSLHLRLWEASRYLLSSSSGLGVLRLSPSRGGRPSFSCLRGTKPPPGPTPAGDSGLWFSPGSGATGRETYLRGAAPGAPASQSAARQPPHLPAAGSPHPGPAAGFCAALFPAWEVG